MLPHRIGYQLCRSRKHALLIGAQCRLGFANEFTTRPGKHQGQQADQK